MTFSAVASESKARFSATVDFILMDIFQRHEIETRDIKRRLNWQYGKFAAQNNYDGYALLRGQSPSLFNAIFGFDL